MLSRIVPVAAIFAFAWLPNCLEANLCNSRDITCSPQGWFLYLLEANAAAAEPALCSGGSATVTGFYGYYGGNGNDTANSVCATRDGGYVFAGQALNNIASLGGVSPVITYQGGTDAMIAKLNASGIVEWYSFVGSAGGTDSFLEVTEAADGGFVAVGAANATIATLGGVAPIIPFQGTADWIVVRFSATGSVEWWTFLGDTATANQSAEGIVPTSDGGYIVTGLSGDMDSMPVAALNAYAGNTFDMTAVKLSSAGIVEWFRYFGSGANEQSLDLTATADGNFVTTGLTLGNFTNVGGATPLLAYIGPQDTPVVKFDASGNLVWHTFLGAGGGNQIAEAVTSTPDSGLAVLMRATGNVATLGGFAPLLPYNTNDLYIAKLTAAGAVEWHTFIGTAGSENAGHIAAFADGSLLVSGSAPADIPTFGGKTPLNPYSTADDILIMKFTSAGAVDWYTFVGGVGGDSPTSLAITRDGGFVLGGQSASNLANIGSLTPANPFVNSGEPFVIRGNADGSFQ
ncbi:MAG: hypothetical protein NXI24_14430 [bacterium]|nr:hypothetical protein [bacterium]